MKQLLSSRLITTHGGKPVIGRTGISPRSSAITSWSRNPCDFSVDPCGRIADLISRDYNLRQPLSSLRHNWSDWCHCDQSGMCEQSMTYFRFQIILKSRIQDFHKHREIVQPVLCRVIFTAVRRGTKLSLLSCGIKQVELSKVTSFDYTPSPSMQSCCTENTPGSNVGSQGFEIRHRILRVGLP